MKLVVLISGSGSNLQAILDACANGTLAAEVVGVVSNRSEAYGLTRAKSARVATTVLERQKSQSRANYDTQLAQVVADYAPDLIVLAGWMRLLTMAFLERFPMQVINLHPALPGQYPGTHAIERAYNDYVAGKITESGVMVHFVPDEGVDDGPVIATATVAFLEGETLDGFEARMHAAEHALLVEAIQRLSKPA